MRYYHYPQQMGTKTVQVKLSALEHHYLLDVLSSRDVSASTFIRGLLTPYINPPVIDRWMPEHERFENIPSEETILIEVDQVPLRIRHSAAKKLLKQLMRELVNDMK